MFIHAAILGDCWRQKVPELGCVFVTKHSVACRHRERLNHLTFAMLPFSRDPKTGGSHTQVQDGLCRLASG